MGPLTTEEKGSLEMGEGLEREPGMQRNLVVYGSDSGSPCAVLSTWDKGSLTAPGKEQFLPKT